MNENWNPTDDAIDILLDSRTPYSKRREVLKNLSHGQIEEILEYSKRYSELEPQVANRLIEDIYGLQL